MQHSKRVCLRRSAGMSAGPLTQFDRVFTTGPLMSSTWLLSIAGRDNPEVLQRLTETVALCEGRVLDQQITGMNGRLTGFLKFRMPNQYEDYAWRQIQLLAVYGLQVLSRDRLTSERENGTLTLRITGRYRIGLDHDIRLILESHRIMVDEYRQDAGDRSTMDAQEFQTLIKGRVIGKLCEHRLLSALKRLTCGMEITIKTIEKRATSSLH